MKRILTIITAIICMCSCEKEQAHWLYDRWSGEYDTTMTNNDTGEKEEHIASISLEFSEDRSECIVTKGIQGMYAITRNTYCAYLNESEDSFVLNEGDYDSRILFWGNITEDQALILNWYSGEKLMTVELRALKNK